MFSINRLCVLLLGLAAASMYVASPDDEKIVGRVDYAGPYKIGAARNIVGVGTCGNDTVGPIAMFGPDANGVAGDGFVISGEGAPYRATGGSLQNLRVIRKAGAFGGRAVVVTAIDAAQRSGEVRLDRLKIFNESALAGGAASQWDQGLVIDGSMLTTSGAAGIRSVTINDVRVAGCKGRFVLLNNAVHCRMSNLQIDPGGSPLAVMEIKDGQNIEGVNLIINGDLIFTGNPVEVSLTGRFHTIRIGAGARAVTIFGTTHFLYVEPGATGAFYGHISEGVANGSASFAVK